MTLVCDTASTQICAQVSSFPQSLHASALYHALGTAATEEKVTKERDEGRSKGMQRGKKTRPHLLASTTSPYVLSRRAGAGLTGSKALSTLAMDGGCY
jgi:hypothetical protein